jgi:hypothetical protein
MRFIDVSPLIPDHLQIATGFRARILSRHSTQTGNHGGNIQRRHALRRRRRRTQAADEAG